MENTSFLSNDRLKISPRAYALALQNNVDILRIVPTGPEGRIIENDILRAIEERNKAKAEEKPEVEVKDEPIAPITEEPTLAPAEDSAPEVKEDAIEEVAEEALETSQEEIVEEATEETPTEAEETTEEAPEASQEEVIEKATEETPAEAEETTEEAPVTEENNEEVTEEIAEEVSETETKEETEEASAKTEVTEEETEEKPNETAIVAAPVTAVANEEKKEESSEKESTSEKTFRSEDAYRHTDVIISQSENAPTATAITIEMSFDATAITGLRDKIKANGEAMGLPSVTLNDMILFATAKILKKHKAMNAHFLEDKIRYFDGIHLGFAVDTDRGPQTLTVFDADRLSLSSLSKITGALVRGVRAGGEVPEKNLRMGSFTVTNVGTLGIERFTPVLTAPQTGVLGVCALHKRVRSMDGEDVIYPCIPLALTFDPRAMSTANAAKFLRDLCQALENFGLLLIK
jgi:pyruvate/2-oxoglutarate dehydrogenase complex dihydrolipoamide acyltransferase (E2) component